MDITTLISEFQEQNIQSEAEVRSKLIAPLLELLEYPKAFRAEEFPIYGYEGSKELGAKAADYLQFLSADFAKHRGKSETDLKWVYENSLLVFEAKKPSEKILVTRQPVFYSAWTKSIAYIISNGVTIEGYIVNANYSDKCVFSCDVNEIPENWDKINTLNYNNILELKHAAEYGNKWVNNNQYEPYKNAWRVKLTSELYASIERSFERVAYEPKLLKNLDRQHYEDILNCENKIITSEPGGGKSYLMYMLLRDYMAMYADTDNKIPILLEGQYFSKVYHSIAEGIYKQLNILLPFVTMDIVNKRIREGGYIILFDALDEVENNRDKLIYELHKLSDTTENTIIITARIQNYTDEFQSKFIHYSLDRLSNEDISRLLKIYSNGKIQFSSYNIPARLLEVIRTPLFLKLFVAIVLQGETYKVPSNHSKLFGMYISEKFKKLSCSEYEINIIRKILSNYAVFTYENKEDSDKFFEIVEEKCVSLNSKEIYNIIWKTGIIRTGSQGIKFFHKAMQEFLVAVYISKLSPIEINDWLDKNVNNNKYCEVICYLTGVLADQDKQNQVLDYLQDKNLMLFFKALKSRRNFTFDDCLLNNEFVEAYFTQILNTYKSIIDKHFSCFSNYFDGYDFCCNNRPCIKGAMNLDSGAIELIIYNGTENALEVDTKTTDSNGTNMISSEGVNIPIFSSVFPMGNSHLRGYNLDLLSYGFDSSREIAVDIIKNQINELLKNEIVFDTNVDVLLIEHIENILKKLNLLSNTTKTPLSLYNDEPKKIINEVIASKRNSHDIQLLLSLLKVLEGKNCKITDYLDIKADLEPSQNQGCYWVYQLFSDECLVAKVKRIISLTKQSVNQIVTQHLPVLQSVYKNQRSIGIVCRDKNGGGVNQIHILSNSKEIQETIIEYVEKDIPYFELDNYYYEKLTQLGIRKNDIVSRSSSALFCFFGNEVFHKHIYGEIKELFSSLFGERP